MRQYVKVLSLIDIIGYMIPLLASIPAICQIRYSLRLSSVDGVSRATTTAWVWSWTAWILYGLTIASAPIMLKNFVGLVPALVLMMVYHRMSPMSVGSVAQTLLPYSAVICTILYYPSVGVWALSFLDIIFYMPSAVVALRTKEPVGVSLGGVLSHIAISGSWWLYLAAIGEYAAGTGWVVGMICSTVIAMRLIHYRGRATSLDAVVAPRNVVLRPLSRKITRRQDSQTANAARRAGGERELAHAAKNLA